MGWIARSAQARYGRSQGGQPQAKVESLPAPLGGWNARDSLANMDPMDAVTLINMFPGPTSVSLRGGYTQHATGIPGQVQTLVVWTGGNLVKMFAFTDGGNVYDVSSAGAVGAAVVTGLSNAIWNYASITTPGGNYILCCNGVDKPLLFDGTTWTPIDGASTPAITGVTTTSLENVILHNHRLWFIEKQTLRAWYLPTDSIGGALSEFDLSAVARWGGHLNDFDTWTVDAGYGADDMLVFVTSIGEVIVYRGTDPASTATFAQVGSWKLGSPISDRSFLKWGGDLLLLTFDGLLPLSAALQSDRLDPRVALSDKIQGAIASATTLYGGSHASTTGWQVVYSAKANAVWINIPVQSGMQQQYVMNTITKSWCQFTGWAANCWEIYSDDAYFGGDGFVGKAWDPSYADNGTSIQTQTLQAFNYYEERGVKKQFTRMRPSILTDGSPSINMGMNIDFDLSDTTAPAAFLPLDYALWDTAVWDVGVWGQDLAVANTWLGATGIGYCGAVQMRTASQGLQIQWASTDVVYQTGWPGV